MFDLIKKFNIIKRILIERKKISLINEVLSNKIFK